MADLARYYLELGLPQVEVDDIVYQTFKGDGVSFEEAQVLVYYTRLDLINAS